MRKNFWKFLTVAMLITVSLTAVAFAHGDEANGTVVISSAEDLMKLSDSLDGDFVLGADVDLTGVNFTSIGDENAPFSGNFDGQGHTITVKDKALFGALSGRVANLKLAGSIDVSVGKADVGVLADKAFGGAVVDRCENLATLSVTFKEAKTRVAPFVANVVEGTVTVRNCINRGEISFATSESVEASVGGLVGYVEDAAKVNVYRCANYAHIKVDGGKINAGGIVGQTSVGDASTTAIIEQCANKGNIDYFNLEGERAAGIIGYIKNGKIISCYNVAEIKAYSDNGKTESKHGYGTTFGIFGYANLTTSSSVEVKGCYNASKDPLEAEICVIRNASYGKFDNFVMASREEYELTLMSANVSTGEKGTTFTNETDLLGLIQNKYACYVENPQGGYPVLAWEFGAVIETMDNGFGLGFSFRQNETNLDSHDMRICVTAKDSFFESQAKVAFRIEFIKDAKKILEHTPILSPYGKEFKKYNSIYADGIEYRAEEGSTVYVATVEQIPYEAWDSVYVYAEINGEYQNLGNISYSRVYNHQDVSTFAEIPGYRTFEGKASSRYNCGPMLADDSSSLTGEESYMYFIENTSEREFAAYIDRLKNNGFEIAQDRKIDSNRTCTVYKEGVKGYFVVYYIANKEQVQIIHEKSSNVMPTDISYDYNKPDAAVPILYQYSLNYTNAGITYTNSGAKDCGMLYIIRLPDNSLFLVDSGHGAQVSQTSIDGIYAFMKKITGTKDNEKIRIAGWFFTHAHGDHNGLAAAFLGYKYGSVSVKFSYADKVDVQSVIFNYPSYQTMSSGYALTEVKVMKQAMRELYPNIKTLKVHTGQRFTLAGVHFDTLFTHEDMVESNGKTTITNFNNTSTVLKITFPGGQTYMQLGDMDQAASSVFNSMYSKQAMESDIVQVAHHAINDIKSTYAKINAPIAIVPQSESNAKARKWSSFATYSKDIYCADVYTYGFVMRNTGDIDVERHNHVG